LVVVGRVVRVERLPLPPLPPRDPKTGEINIRIHFPQLVHFKVREVVLGELRDSEVTFLYWSHLGFRNQSSDYVLALRPVDGVRWEWELPNDGRLPLLNTKDGQQAVPLDRESWTHLPCAVLSRMVPIEFVLAEPYGKYLPTTGILLTDLRKSLRGLDPIEAEMSCHGGDARRATSR
jgi:hypothetical protein